MYIYTNVCMYICNVIYIHMYMYMYVHTHTHTHMAQVQLETISDQQAKTKTDRMLGAWDGSDEQGGCGGEDGVGDGDGIGGGKNGVEEWGGVGRDKAAGGGVSESAHRKFVAVTMRLTGCKGELLQDCCGDVTKIKVRIRRLALSCCVVLHELSTTYV